MASLKRPAAAAGRRLGPATKVARWAAGMTAAVLSVAGCVSMSSGGPPSSVSATQNDTGQNQDYVGAFPSGPGSNWSPEQIVEGFLFASASYYTTGAIAALEYLTPDAARSWKPDGSVTVFQTWSVHSARSSPDNRAAKPAMVTVSGNVNATLNGAGQQQLYASAAQGSSQGAPPATASGGSCHAGGQTSCYPFTLIKSGGQWRIANPPHYLLVDESDFQRAWEPQDLYFFDSVRQKLIPDSVFVPLGTSETDLLNKLASALKAGPPAWLQGATVNVFPAPVNVTVTADLSEAIVNLEGARPHTVHIDQATLTLIGAELVWTLTSARQSAIQSAIQSVQMEINGSPVSPPGPWYRDNYNGYDPYPSQQPASFAYVDHSGAAVSRCGSVPDAARSPAVPLLSHPKGGTVASCGDSASSAPSGLSPSAGSSGSGASSPAAPSGSGSGSGSVASGSGSARKPGHAGKPGTKTNRNAYSMVAVSPDGKSVAVVSARDTTLSVGPVGDLSALKSMGFPGSDITSISWDRQHNLWVTQDGSIWVVPLVGKVYQITLGGTVSTLAVAPDGVRVAMIMQPGGTGNELELAAIIPAGTSASQQPPHGNPAVGLTLGPLVPLGPSITNSMALTWYDADDLIVLERGGQLAEVPVDGRASSQQLAAVQVPTGATVSSVAAGNSKNFVVVGLSDGQLEVSFGFEGPWLSVAGGGGSEPSYWIPSGTSK
jgi:hypothetical protein